MTQAARAAMDGQEHVIARKPERGRRGGVEYLGHHLHFEIVIAGAERAHFAALAVFRALRHAVREGVVHRAALLDAIEIVGLAEAARERPGGAAGEHPVHLGRIERDRPFAADSRRNVAEELVGEFALNRRDVAEGQPCEHRAHAAGNVEADAARRYDAALVGIEGGHPADREPIAPMRVRHRVNRLHDARQPRHIGGLLVDLIVHVGDERVVGVDDSRHAHAAHRLDAPCRFIEPREAGRIHRGRRSDVDDATGRP